MTLARTPGYSIRPSAPRALRHLAAGIALSWLVGMGIAQAADPKASRYYEDALTRYEKKDFPGAIIQLKNALQIDPKMLPVQLLLARALMRNSEVVAAEVAYLEALKLGVSRSELVVELARAVVAQGKHRQVFEQPHFALGGLPSDVVFQMHLVRAATYADLGDVRSAMRSIDEARKMQPTSAESFAAEVPVRIRANQLADALVAADKALALDAKSTEALYQKASVHLLQGDAKTAQTLFNRVIGLDADHIESRVALAGMLFDQGQLDAAAKQVTEALRVYPEEPRALYLQAMLLEQQGKPKDATPLLKQITELIDAVPLDFVRYRPQILTLNSLAHFALGEREKARPYLEALQTIQPASPQVKLLAQIQMAESNLDRAIDTLERFTKANPRDTQATAMLASALMARGHHARAASLMQEAVKLRDTPELRTTLGLSLIGSRRVAGGVAELEAAFKRDPNQTRAGAALVMLYLNSKQVPKAVSMAQSLVKIEPGNPSYQNLLGLALSQAGQGKDARGAFESALKINPDMDTAQINLARLDIANNALDLAEKRLLDLINRREKNIDGMIEMASLSVRRNNLPEAIRWLQRADDVAGPRDVRAGVVLAQMHLAAREPAKALEVARKVSAKDPENIGALTNLAQMQIVNNDNIGARTTLNNATRFAEYNAPLLVELAKMQSSINHLDGATYTLTKALSSQPDFLPAQALLAEVEIRSNDFASAERRVRELVAQHPRVSIGYSLQGDLAARRGQAAAATDAYRRAHQVQPTTDTLMRLFRHLVTTESSSRSGLALLDDWVKAHPKDVTARRAAAEAQARDGNLAAAKAGYEELLKLAPDDAAALNNLADVLLRSNDLAGAVKTAEKAYARAPGSAPVIDTLGWALFQSGQTERGLQLMRDARLRAPANTEIRLHLAEALIRVGRRAEANVELDALVKMAGSQPAVNKEIQRLRVAAKTPS